jgi:spore coat protein H
MIQKSIQKGVLMVFVLTLFFSCKDKDLDFTPSPQNYPEWEANSHGSQASPNYEVVFPKDKIQTLDIVLRKSDWDSLNMRQKDSYYGVEFGTAFNRITAKQSQLLNNSFSGSFIGKTAPAFVEAQLKFNNKTWRNVGLRYDGVLPLITNWTSGIRKLPFLIEGNSFEGKYPDTKGQKIYGFKALSFDPGFNDTVMISNKISSEVFNDNGVPCPRKAFYKVYIDYGEGRKYFGVYTASELAEDAFVKGTFDNNNGNIYQPFSTLKTFSKGFMVKKNNVSEANFADIETLVSVLNSTKRTTDKALWLGQLNKQLDVEKYLKWLAINTAIRGDENHDEGYGLYTQSNLKMAIFPFQTTYCFRFPPTSMTQQPDTEITVDLGYTKASDQYPLVKYLLAEPDYFAKYKQYVKVFNDTYFLVDKMTALVERNHALIAPAIAEEIAPFSQLKNPTQFTSGLSDMKNFITKQKALLVDFVK